MAGAGYKLFNTGDVLTAAQVNTYLQEQVVMVFANATSRTTALSGVLAEGMVSYLQDTNAVEVYNGTAWVGVSGAGDVTEVQAGTGISVASGTGPIPVVTNSMATAIDAKGDLVAGTGADTFARLAVGANDTVLTADSSTATGLKWASAAGSSGPTFRARVGTTQSFSQNTVTKVQFDTEIWDTDSCYDPTTNYRFTPNKAGYYIINSNMYLQQADLQDAQIYIRKNGSDYSLAYYGDADANANLQVTGFASMNGSSDYVEIFVWSESSGTREVLAGAQTSWFEAIWIRGL